MCTTRYSIGKFNVQRHEPLELDEGRTGNLNGTGEDEDPAEGVDFDQAAGHERSGSRSEGSSDVDNCEQRRSVSTSSTEVAGQIFTERRHAPPSSRVRDVFGTMAESSAPCDRQGQRQLGSRGAV